MTLYAGNYVWDNVPVYVLVAAALLVGVVLAWMLNLIDGAYYALVAMWKKHAIEQRERELVNLKYRVEELVAENARLKEEKRALQIEQVKDHLRQTPTKIKDFFGNLRHNLSI